MTPGPAIPGRAAQDRGMEAEAHLTLAQWLSPAFPTGGFAWSHGLETAVATGAVADAAGLESWIGTLLLRGAGRSDAILLTEAARAEGPALAALAELALALAPSAERLAEIREQGAAFAAALRGSWGFDLPDLPLPVAVGRAVALAGLPPGPAVRLHLLNLASGQVQAALRLMPLGQTAGQAVLRRLIPLCIRIAEETRTLSVEDLGGCALGIDIAALQHETCFPRIFRS